MTKPPTAADPSARTGFRWDDPLLFDDQLTGAERALAARARDYAQAKLAPRIADAYEHETVDRAESEDGVKRVAALYARMRG